MTQPIDSQTVSRKEKQMQGEMAALRQQLHECQEVLAAIRNGEVDAIVVTATQGERIFSLTSSETPYRILVEEMNEGALILTAAGTILYANKRACQLFSLPVECIVGEEFSALLDETQQRMLPELIKKALTTKFSISLNYKAPGDKRFFLRLSFSPLPKNMLGEICITAIDLSEMKEKEVAILEASIQVQKQASQLTETNEMLASSRVAVLNMMKDTVDAKDRLEVTYHDLLKEVEERKRAEEDLRKSEEFIRRVIASSNDCICVLDLDGSLLSMNEGGIEALEIANIDNYLHQSWLNLWFGKDRAMASEAVEKSIAGAPAKFTAYSKTERGHAKWWEVVISPVKNANGEIEQLLAIARDNTQRFNAETALIRSEINLRAIFENASTGFLLIDKNFFVIEFNSLFDDYSVYAWNKAIKKGDKLLDLMPPERKQGFLDNYISKVSQGQAISYNMSYGKNGKTEIYKINVNPVRDSSNQLVGTCITCEKITDRVHAEEVLRQSEERFRTLFETMDQGFCVIEMINDEEGKPIDYRFLEINPAFEKHTGLQYALGKRIKELAPDMERFWFETYGKVAATGESVRFENFAGQLNRHYNVYAFRIGNAGSKRVGVLFTDITENKAAQEKLIQSEKRFRELIESLPQLFWTCTPEGSFDYLSKQWVEYTGLPEEEQLGYGWLQQIHPDDRDRVKEEWALRVIEQENFDLEFRIKKHTGEYNWFRTRAVPIADDQGRLLKWFGSNTNFDEVKKAEEEIRQLNAGLEEKIRERTAQFEMVNKELEAFSYSVSHDLRAPLRALNSYAQILLDDYGVSINDDGQKILTSIRYNTRKMGMLIDELLAFSRLGRKEIIKGTVHMDELVASVIDDLEKLYTHISRIEVAPLPNVKADYSLLYQVMHNLIGNAIKYSSKKDNPLIEIFTRQEEGKTVFVVKDNGAGFDMRYAGKLFGVFQRLHSEAEFEGNGVGLAIVQRIINKHHGEVWGEAVENEGASFYFTLSQNGTK